IIERDVFSHLRIKLLDHGKLSLQRIIQNQNNELRYAQDVRINKLSKLEHFVVIDVPPHIGLRENRKSASQEATIHGKIGRRLARAQTERQIPAQGLDDIFHKPAYRHYL
ncbi:MAG: hypothetical protein WCD73_19075, partial [Pseudolabrys sp.]